MTSIKQLPSSLELKYPRHTVYCVVVASLAFFCIGWVTGSPNLPGAVTHACENGASHVASAIFPDCLPMSSALWGFAVASFCIGALIGGLGGGLVQTKLGRRKTIVLNTTGYIIGGILLGLATSPVMFTIGRILCGLSCGIASLTVPTYVGEISTIKARGEMATMPQLMCCTGILLSSIVGLFLSSVPLWRINYALVALPALVQAMLMFFCAESPRYLISINRIEEARANLQNLRPGSNIDVEFYTMVEVQLGAKAAAATVLLEFPTVMQEEIPVDYFQSKDNKEELGATIYTKDPNNNNNSSTSTVGTPLSTPPLPTPPPLYTEATISADSEPTSPMNMIQIFRDPLIRKIALVLIVMHALQQLIGINAVMYYSTDMFSTAFNPEMARYMAMVSNAVNFIMTIVSIFLVDRTGRRALLLVSEAGACLFAFLLTIAYIYNISALMVVSILAYVAFFATGMGSIPWVLISELSPVYASSSTGSIAAATNWSMNFLIGQCFPVIFAKLQGYSFIIFGVIGVVAITFTYFKLPETKGRSQEEITAAFK